MFKRFCNLSLRGCVTKTGAVNGYTSALKRALSTSQNSIQNWEDILTKNASAVNSAEQTESFYDSWSNDYDRCVKSWGYIVDGECVKLLKKYGVNSGTLNILDFGCGSGLIGSELAKHKGLRYNLNGCDLSNDMLGIAREKNVYNDLIQLNMNEIPYNVFRDNQFDALICCGVLTYAKDISRILREWSRIIKTDGVIITSHRSDKMVNDIKYFNELSNQNKWHLLEHIKSLEYLPKNPNYGDNILVDIYVVRNN